ncbi:MAG: indolepyruvate ferredoxin oxidoreductase subunit alpha [Gammaproteobacteria bacterium]|nr:indolepyruvate ferredoxin oxidoreductase subunit alpha [Gammaproteobacteria bacterium]
MAERSFAREVRTLELGDGELFHGEGILAVAKALLQSGVAYVGGYQGAPITHLMDVFADARAILDGLGVHFESSANEAAAAAMLAASVTYPLRGAVTWKSPVGTNVAADALSNIASAGVQGGALVIVGEDYGEGASVIQERAHAFAMKSQIWLLDPRPSLPVITRMVEQGFELSEASHTPVMLELRIRACHVRGTFRTTANRRPAFTVVDALDNPQRLDDRVLMPPYLFEHEQEKVRDRWPAAVRFIRERGLNERIDAPAERVGIVVQGGLYNTLNRALELLGCADAFGASEIPLYVLNVTYPLVEEELLDFCRGKDAILIVEEGQPNFIEQSINSILRERDVATRVDGKSVLPRAGEYTGQVLTGGVHKFLEQRAPELIGRRGAVRGARASAAGELAATMPERPPGLCTGCPERPLFTAMKLLARETGPLQVSADIGCHTFATLPPFKMGSTVTGYGLGPASASALNIRHRRRAISLIGDGGLWHNGLASGIGNAVENRHDGVIVVVDNGYTAATGGQWVPSSRADAGNRQYRIPIVQAIKGMGVRRVRRIRTFNIAEGLKTLREAMTTPAHGPKVIIAEGECQLNRDRRIRPLLRQWLAEGRRHVREHFGVDEDCCTGDHSCIRLSGCPSLTIRDNPDPLRRDPVATVLSSCVGCGVCGEVAHAAVLCPSFYRAEIVRNPTRFDRWLWRLRRGAIARLQARTERRLACFAV